MKIQNLLSKSKIVLLAFGGGAVSLWAFLLIVQMALPAQAAPSTALIDTTVTFPSMSDASVGTIRSISNTWPPGAGDVRSQDPATNQNQIYAYFAAGSYLD